MCAGPTVLPIAKPALCAAIGLDGNLILQSPLSSWHFMPACAIHPINTSILLSSAHVHLCSCYATPPLPALVSLGNTAISRFMTEACCLGSQKGMRRARWPQRCTPLQACLSHRPQFIDSFSTPALPHWFATLFFTCDRCHAVRVQGGQRPELLHKKMLHRISKGGNPPRAPLNRMPPSPMPPTAAAHTNPATRLPPSAGSAVCRRPHLSQV